MGQSMERKLSPSQRLRRESLKEIQRNLKTLNSTMRSFSKLEPEEYVGKLYQSYKTVHMLRGISTSDDLFMLGTIFHRLEGFLAQHLDKEYVTIVKTKCESYFGLIQLCISEYQKERSDLQKFTSLLEEITLGSAEKNYDGRVLLVDATQSMTKIFHKVADLNNLELVHLESSVTALNRILHEHFDFIAASKSVEVIDGKSLLKSVRVIKGINQKTPLLLISSDDKEREQTEDYVFIAKDQHMLERLSEYFEEMTLVAPALQQGNHLSFPYKKVLIGEFDPTVQELLRRTFHNLKETDIILTSDFKTSLETITKEKPDLIILDYFFRDCAGSQIVEQYFRKHGFLETPVIFLASNEESVYSFPVHEWGNIKGVIEKPIRVTMLLDEILRLASSESKKNED